MLPLMLTSRFPLILAVAGTLLAGCARGPKTSKPPVVETVRTAESLTPPTAARDLADVMASSLQLTPEQTAKVRAILGNTVERVNTAKGKFAPKSAQLMSELKRINTASQKELQVVLGPAKFKQLQANQRKMAAEMQQRQTK